ncbi:hypothetical protein PTKIN_Ptkin05aG0217200 [Pterospermum kingtungense]
MILSGSMRIVTLIFLALLIQLATTVRNFSAARTNVTCHEFEGQALVRFKQDLTDPSGRLASWGNEPNCCTWPGVTCDEKTGHVLKLRLRNPLDPYNEFYIPSEAYAKLWFGGNINPSLQDLKHLRYLDLSGSNFGGMQIPKFLTAMHSLRYLNLSASGFGGLVPPQLANLTNLRFLDLHDFAPLLYVDNLQWLSNLVKLKHLDLSRVDLSKASDWFQVTNSLPSLVELHLSGCNLDHLPTQTNASFSSLSILDLSSNSFTNPLIPEWIFRLNSLVSLDLSHNNFESPLPDGLQNFTSLRYLNLYWNNFNSSIPTWLYGFKSLEFLNLGSNYFLGSISNDLGNLTSITTLDISDNELEGFVPRSMGSLCRLKKIKLSGLKLTQDLSQVLQALSSGCLSDSLVSLYLDICELSGHLTDQLQLFKNLADLSLSRNSISGPIPESLALLASLKTLDLSRNRVNGTLPLSLRQLWKMERLWLSHNLLKGVVSEAHFVNLTRLRLFQASGNPLVLKVSSQWVPPFDLKVMAFSSWHLGPKFPPWLRSQQDFVYLDISVTGIIDTIPNWFWNLSTLFFSVNLSHNQIYGKVPEYIASSPLIAEPLYIDLSSNNFVGPLPCFSSKVNTLELSNNSFSGPMSPLLCCNMYQPKGLEILHLADNNLSGEIPDCWMNWPNLVSIDLKNNHLSGNIPSSMGSLNLLQSLHLGKNNLSGVLPSSLQNCSMLLAIDLDDNNFVGNIPGWIGDRLSNIIIISLRSNGFDGQVPDQLCSLSYLAILDLAHNNLSGNIPKCFMNLSAMAENQNSTDPISYSFGHFGTSLETFLLMIKGILLEYSSTLQLVTSMDLSDNNISGEIPADIANLLGLRFLNLSNNHLTGVIPKNIGNMRLLESVDLSWNQISGEIPPSMSALTFLSYLNLSSNDLTGKIPSSTQLQSFNVSSYEGNNLCGPPLLKTCIPNATIPVDDNRGSEADGFEVDWFSFYVSVALGFVVGFSLVMGPLLFNKSWRFAYYGMLDRVWHKIRAVATNGRY